MAALTANETTLLNVLLMNARFEARGFTVENAHAQIKENILHVTFRVVDDPQTDPLFGEVPILMDLPVRGLDTEWKWAPLLEVEAGAAQTERRRYVSFGPILCTNAPIIELLFTQGEAEK